MTRTNGMRMSAIESLAVLLTLAAVCWAVGLLWPLLSKSMPKLRANPELRKTRFVFRAPAGDNSTWSPTLLVLPSRGGFSGALRDETRQEQSLTSVRSDPAVVLKRPPSTIRPQEMPMNDLVEQASSIRSREPLPSEQPVFEISDKTPEVMISVSSKLKTHGFKIPQFENADLLETAKPWIVRAYVDVGENGDVRHVFLESPADNEGVNQAVIRAVYQGRLRSQGPACYGTVVLSRR